MSNAILTQSTTFQMRFLPDEEPMLVVIAGNEATDVQIAENLIKAAPVLYATLDDLVNTIRLSHPEHACPTDKCTLCDAIYNADRAGAKARGARLQGDRGKQ